MHVFHITHYKINVCVKSKICIYLYTPLVSSTGRLEDNIFLLMFVQCRTNFPGTHITTPPPRYLFTERYFFSMAKRGKGSIEKMEHTFFCFVQTTHFNPPPLNNVESCLGTGASRFHRTFHPTTFLKNRTATIHQSHQM